MEGLARIVIILLAVAIAIQFAKAGPKGAKRWLAAKFLGKQAA